MGQLFGCLSDNVGLHLKNLYTEGEIDFEATTEEISVVRKEWGVPHYLLVRVFFTTDKSLMPHFRGSKVSSSGLEIYVPQGGDVVDAAPTPDSRLGLLR